MVSPIKVIRDLIGVQESIGEFIRNGPSTGLPGYVRDQYRDRCDQFANLPGWAQVLGNGTTGTMDRICTPYWDDGGFDGPEIGPPPFPGGQCEGVIYTVTLQNNSTSGPFGAPQTRSGPGPVVGAFVTITLAPSTGVAGIEFANGKVNTLSGGSVAAPTILGVVRQDGQPDLCGDPPAPIVPGPNPPPDPGPTPGPEPTTDPDDPTGPPLIPIPPYVDPIYGPTPIVAPTDGGGAGGTGGGDGLPGDPDAIADSVGGAGGGEDGEDINFGQPPDGKIWVGALVQATVDSRLGNIPGTGPAQTVYPAVIGNASLIYTGGRGTNERLESSSTLIVRATTALVLTGCRAQAQPGVNLTVKPISATTCPDNPCEETDG